MCDVVVFSNGAVWFGLFAVSVLPEYLCLFVEPTPLIFDSGELWWWVSWSDGVICARLAWVDGVAFLGLR